jgi:hypothetical protein
VLAAFNGSPIGIAAFQIDFPENHRLVPGDLVWLHVSHTENLANARGECLEFGGNPKLKEFCARQAKVVGGERS